MEGDGKMGLTLEKYTPLAYWVGLMLLIGISIVSYRSLNDLTQTADQVSHTHQVIAELEETLSDFKDVVIGYRGYVMTGSESFLKVYYQARQDIAPDIGELRKMTADNPKYGRWLDELEKLREQSLSHSEEVIQTRRTRGYNEAVTMLERESGQTLLEEIRRVVKE